MAFKKSHRDQTRPAIQDQYETNHCFFHAATTVMEYKYFLRKKMRVDFSDHSRLIRNGINESEFLKFFCRHPYVTTKENYPPNRPNNFYKKMKFKPKQWKHPRYKFKWEKVVQRNNDENYEAAMLRELKKQPLVGFIQATRNFINLEEDMYTTEPMDRDIDITDHAVAIIGYGVDDEGREFWIIQNSYGPEWGVGGIGRVERGINAGGIGFSAFFPLLDEEDEDEEVEVRLKKPKREVVRGHKLKGKFGRSMLEDDNYFPAANDMCQDGEGLHSTEIAEELKHDVSSQSDVDKLVNESKDCADGMESSNMASDKVDCRANTEAGHRRRRWFENGEKSGATKQEKEIKQELHETSSEELANTHQSEVHSKEREKEKERPAVERAIREACQRAFVEA